MEHGISAEAVEMIGKERTREYEVTRRDIKRFAQAIGDENRLYYDVEYAAKTSFGTIVAPPLFCHALAFEDVSIDQLLPDGSPAEINVPITAKRTVGGGSVFENFIRIKPGDKILIKSRIKDIYTKPGRQGVLYFVIQESSFYNQNDELAARETATFIKRV